MSNSDEESPPDIVAETPLRDLQERLSVIRRESGEQRTTSQRERESDLLARRLGFEGEERTDLVESPTVEREEEQQEEEEEETSRNILRTSNMTSTPPASLPTVHGSASDMFKDTGPRDKRNLANGTCPNPRSKRGATEKDIARTKERAVQPINSLFESPYYYVSGKYDVDDDKQALHKSACDAIISCTFSCSEMKLRVESYDMLNSVLIPVLVDPGGINPAARWDFTKDRRNLLEEFGSITFEEVKQWTEDSLLWSQSEFESQDQEWLLTFTRNSCKTDLLVKVEEKFHKLEGHHKGGTTYLWLMLHTVVYITDDVATSLKGIVKSFATKGLKSYAGENVETAKTELLSISTRLFERNKLPDDAVDDTLAGLAICSHTDFAALFFQLSTARKNKLMSPVGIKGNLIQQLKLIWAEADTHYTSYHLAGNWNVPGGAAHYGGQKDVDPSVKCDNCGQNHYVTNCPKQRDEARIDAAREARQDKARKKRGGQRSQKSGNGGRGGGKRNYGHNPYGKGKWKPPVQGETVRKIEKKVYCACKLCGWTTGSNAHSSGKHEEWEANPGAFSLAETHPYMKQLALLGMKSPFTGKSAGIEKKKTETSSTSGGTAGLSSLAQHALAFEKETENPEAAAFAGQFAAMLSAMAEMSLKG